MLRKRNVPVEMTGAFRTSEKDIEGIVEIIVRSGRKVVEFIKNKPV
jgi:hypothetical protein